MLGNHYSLFFYDLEKAFDKVSRTAMRMVLWRLGCPELFIGLVCALHEGMSVCVFHHNRLTEKFPIISGLKQCCILAPALSSLYLAAILHDIPLDNPGINIQYRLWQTYFQLRSCRYTSIRYITQLQYADDNATPFHSTNDLQQSINNFCSAHSCYGLCHCVCQIEQSACPTHSKNF